MSLERLRLLLAVSTPLLYGAIAFSVQLSAARAFDERMLRDREALEQRLVSHGATPEQAADVRAWAADASHDVAGLVDATGSSAISMLGFMGITLAAILGARRPDAQRG